MDPIDTRAEAFDFEACFHANYSRIARAIARIVGDSGRAEELAVEAFWKLWRTPQAHGESAGGWLYRTAVRMGLNDLRGSERRSRYERQADTPPAAPTPEEVHAAGRQRDQVRHVLGLLEPREAELLLLRSQGFRYDEIAAAVNVKPTSVGTLIVRAQQAFRKEYLKLYGEE
ncbi:MAG TPA: sigma-70 family RNA polymerase sigma factor [Acetobacteraceae bacterium]|jgi:RNA polymerase sigma-70 factor (ECF subfamily)